jgi:hypothetical protein
MLVRLLCLGFWFFGGSLLDEVLLKTVLGDFSEAPNQSFQCLKRFSDSEE